MKPLVEVSLPYAIMLYVMLIAGAYAGDLPFVPFPKNVNVVVVGEDIKVNGLPIMAYEFASNDPVEEVAKFYRDIWTSEVEDSDAKGQPFLETRLRHWLVISRLEKGHNITVQIEKTPLGQSHALVGVSPLPKLAKSGRKNVYEINIPKLMGMDIVSVVASNDKGKKSEIYWIDSSRGVETTLEEFKDYYDKNGGSTKGYKVETDPGKESKYGTLQVTTEKASFRFDAIKMSDKTRVIALCQPY